MGVPVLMLGGVLFVFDSSPSKFAWSRMVTWTPFVRVPVGVGGLIVFGAVGLLRLRLWRGEPLVEVTDERMSIAQLWGRLSIDRTDIEELNVWTRGHQCGLEILLASGRRKRIGFKPSGANWYQVVTELDNWRFA